MQASKCMTVNQRCNAQTLVLERQEKYKQRKPQSTRHLTTGDHSHKLASTWPGQPTSADSSPLGHAQTYTHWAHCSLILMCLATLISQLYTVYNIIYIHIPWMWYIHGYSIQ